MRNRFSLGKIRVVTPTGFADAACRAAQNARRHPIGPAGIQIPPARAVWRPEADQETMGKIVAHAEKAYLAAKLPEVERGAAVALVASHVREHFNQADMAVLKRWGFARSFSTLTVDLHDGVRSEGHDRLELDEPVLLPDCRQSLSMRDTGDAGRRIPDAAMPFYLKMTAARRFAENNLRSARSWPAIFKGREKRWPRWHEIEEANPYVGAWLSEQREIMRLATIATAQADRVAEIKGVERG
ncbi:hypothetical protein PQ455_01630 [Sphingomonas naphthae]|uniref:Uncharacterized protein n=1 Tax=Sphingomonas naphthae TaxID=1813468 RepID=A0ABY7TMH6_9SPHN|nr:hypothetical protein [Sphingomonas naphthae]WCT73961.1 hypothetical protein PQ455_01630 [Sphingomonas naphthae]